MPTIAELKTRIQDQIAPGNDEEFLRIIQEVEIRLCEYGGRWMWTRSRIVLTPVEGIITLPSTHAAILGAQVGDYPASIFAQEYEFVPDGIGDVEVGSNNEYGSVRLIDQGLNDDMERTYKVTGNLPEGITITCLATKAPATLYDPEILVDDIPEGATTRTTCPDLGAIKLTSLAIVLEESNELAKSREYFSVALSGLDSKEKTARGGARQTVNLRPSGPGISRIRSPR